jgi:ATP-dependent helicase/nuclease subunit B
MHEETFRAVEAGATVITASRRLARVLVRNFHLQQKERGRSIWKRPDILPLDAFLDRIWHEWLWRGANGDAAVLLDPFQEQVVWEQIIRESPAGDSLLQIPETARQVIHAWQLVQTYRLPVDGSFEASEDWAAFAEWSRSFRRRCQAQHWLERARLSDVLAPRIASGELPRPGALYIAGFDDLTPQQAAFLDALGERQEVETADVPSQPERRKLRDASEEIRSAARWARHWLEREPEAQIGIIVPDLTRLRPKVERIFREVLDPAGHTGDEERSFHLSLGPPLSEYPMVRAALVMLEFGLDRLVLPQAGLLLRSPFLGGAEAKWNQRALLDAKLRKKGLWDTSLSNLRDAAASCPQLQRVLRRFEKELEKLPDPQRASEWSRDFSRLLEALGWPGDRPLSSREFQTREAWQNLFSRLAALDLATPPLNFAQALDRLRELADATVFQIENEGAPVQIMGLLEASGLRFDHLWIMGLHDEALPAAASPNPFLPISLQRDHKLPHSSAERELEFATRLMERLLVSAPDVVFSYPETEGDRLLAPSPLIAGGQWLTVDEEAGGDRWIGRIRATAEFEEMVDEAAPPMLENGAHSGGSSLFKDMAACPFRAFAKHRLGARPLEESDLGLSYRDRGASVHKALQFLWAEIGSHARLMELALRELQALVARHVEAGVECLGPGIGRNLERRRLEKLLAEWLEIEKSRSEFAVRKSEEDRSVTIGGLQVRIRADRIDELPDGRVIILDYKTGEIKTRGWEGDRPDEPQLPLYCATSDQPVGGAAFALIRTGELGFRGLTNPNAALPEMKEMKISSPLPWEQQVAAWRQVLERLAEDFCAGLAEVDPKQGACDNCGLRALCRIREFENDRG